MFKQFMSGTNNNAKSRRRGSTLVETALVLPILLTVSMLLVQYGIIMSAAGTLSQLSREGARYAAVTPIEDDNIKYAVQKAAVGTVVKYTDLTITVTPAEGDSTRVTGNPITVTVAYDMKKKLFLPSKFFGVNIFNSVYTTKSSFRIE